MNAQANLDIRCSDVSRLSGLQCPGLYGGFALSVHGIGVFICAIKSYLNKGKYINQIP